MANEIQPKQVQELSLYSQEDIQRKIYTIRGVQVMLDRDLATYYQIETRVLNQAVKRNARRFPKRYMFQLTKEEWDYIKSQIVMTSISSQNVMTSIDKRPNAALPLVFTEQGITQLSAVLHSDIAVEMSIRINDAFHAMRKFIINNAGIFQRLEAVELKQISTDKKIDQILDRLDDGSLKAKLGIFFDGQMFDAFVLVEELIQKATRRIVLIDDYVTASVLQRFHKHLRVPETREKQAQLAREAGIEGFCYWHYWFGNGKRLLDRVFREVVESGKPDYPFCLCWANHSWYAKTWDPNVPDKLLMQQTYPGVEDYTAHFMEMLPAFKDKRYMKTEDGRLIFGFFKAWNEWAEGNYLEPDRKWGRGYIEESAKALT